MTRTTKLSVLAALFGLFSVVAAFAQMNPNVSTTPYGDLSLDFRALTGNGSGTNLEVDLGQFSQFLNATPGQIINLSGVNGLSVTDLQDIYGNGTTDNSQWNTRTDLLWSVAGTTYNHIVNSIPRYSFFITAQSDFSNAAQNTSSSSAIYTQINSLSSYPQTGTYPTVNSTVSGAVPAANNGSYSQELGAAGPYGTTQFGGTIETTANTTTGPAEIALFYSKPDATGNSFAQDLGTFELFSNGNFEFVAPAAVPEPSTWAAGALAAVGLVGFAVRRCKAAAI